MVDEPRGHRPAERGVAWVGRRARFEQRLDGHRAPLDRERPGDRRRAREPGLGQGRLSAHDGAARAGLGGGRAARLDDEPPAVGGPHAVHRVDPAGAEQDLGEPARARLLEGAREPGVGLGARERAEDRGLRAAERGVHAADQLAALASSSIAKRNDSEKVGNGWIVSRMTSSGTRARIASVACCSHSPASGPSA